MNKRTYVDVHIIQSVPPSNLNRDDAGSPKQAIYGGVRRARVSSQSWKRATRLAFLEQLPREHLATRTKRISGLLAERLVARAGLELEQAVRISTALLEPLGIKPGKKEAQTSYLLFFGRLQLEHLVDLVADRTGDLAMLDEKALKKELGELAVKEQLKTGHPIDVALFGRMVADLADLNVDAATQVAHAISTHAVEAEFDYYTAVDDEIAQDETGAGMIGTVEFNSATLYRFATVGLHQLSENLGGVTDATVDALEIFLRSFVRSMPSGHQHSFAHRTLPSLVSVVVRPDQPVNLVSAFESPVRSSDGLIEASVDRLAKEMSSVTVRWGLAPLLVASAFELPVGSDPATARSETARREAFGAPLSFEDVVGSALAVARDRVASVA